MPFVSVDHQHFLLAYDLSSLPVSLRCQAWLMSKAVWMYVSDAEATVISAFFRPPLKRGWEHAVQVGPLVRREIVEARPQVYRPPISGSDGGFPPRSVSCPST